MIMCCIYCSTLHFEVRNAWIRKVKICVVKRSVFFSFYSVIDVRHETLGTGTGRQIKVTETRVLCSTLLTYSCLLDQSALPSVLFPLDFFQKTLHFPMWPKL